MSRKKIVLCIILIAVLAVSVPLLVMLTAAYRSMSHTMEREAGEAGTRQLQQSVRGLESLFSQLKEAGTLAAVSPSFSRFERYSGELGSARLYHTGETGSEQETAYAMVRSEAAERLQSLFVAGGFVESVYFYDLNKGIVLALDRKGSPQQYVYGAFYDKSGSIPAQGGSDPLQLNVRSVKGEGGSERKLLTLLIKTGVPGNALAVNLDPALLYGSLHEQNGQAELYAVSASGALVLQPEGRTEAGASNNGYARLQELLRNEADGSAAAIGAVRIASQSGQRVQLASLHSAMLGWTFYRISEWKPFHENAGYLTFGIVYCAVIAAAALIIWFSLKRTAAGSSFRPRTNQAEAGDPSFASDWCELHSEQAASLERDFYQQRWLERLPVYQEAFKRSLIDSRSHTLDELAQQKRRLQLNMELEQLMLMVVSIDPEISGQAPESRLAADELHNLKVLECITSGGIFKGKLFAVEMTEDRIAVVVHTAGSDIIYLLGKVRDLLDRLHNMCTGSFSIGVGRLCDTALDLPRAYEEALEALWQRVTDEANQVIYIDDIAATPQDRMLLSRAQADALLRAVQTGRAAEAVRLFREIAETMRQQSKEAPYGHIQAEWMTLRGRIMAVLHRIGAAAGGADESASVDAGVSRLQTLSESAEMLERYIGDAAKRAGEALRAKDRRLADKLIAMIGTLPDSDLSLHAVAARLQLNPSYIERLFRRSTGGTYADYVNGVRIAKSKQLLLFSQLSAEEIGRKVGYDNMYYFLKIFKEQTGMTPGEFRKSAGKH
ncbi:helix-turn-helix domain-containing protein [Paenibacillus thalictri]|nr:helix-turn-helix domain-containing protein [Paenibacillus thalictri]